MTCETTIQAEKAGQPDTLFAFGDSITAGTGASDAAHRYINLLATYKGWTLTNNAVSGSQISDPTQIDMLYDTTITADMNIVTLAGANDMRTSQSNAALQQTYRNSLLAALAYCALPDTYKTWAPSMSSTGTWVTSPSVSNGKGLRSSTNGSTLTTTVEGDTVYVGYVVSPNYDGTFTVTIDGVNRGTFSTTASVPTRTVDSGEWANVAVRFTGLSDKPHTVVVTITSSTGKDVWIDWIGGNGIPYEITGPNVWVGNCCRMTSGGYSTWGGSDTLVAVWNNMIREVCEALASDGLNVLLVETTDALDPATGLDTDGLHPNDTGHQQIADAFAAKMSSFSKPVDKAQTPRHGLGWITPTLASGWSDYDAGGAGNYGGPRFYKDAAGTVHLDGVAKNTSGSTKPDESLICTLPAGYRPSHIVRFPVVVSTADVATGINTIDVYPDGQVKVTTASVGNNRFVSLTGASFRAEQ